MGRQPDSLFCLAPYGVFRAPLLTHRAVSFYLAFSPLPRLAPRRFIFCDTVRCRRFSSMAPAYSTQHTALWCSDFPPADYSASDHLPPHITISMDGYCSMGK